jgi:hypothetical protein
MPKPSAHPLHLVLWIVGRGEYTPRCAFLNIIIYWNNKVKCDSASISHKCPQQRLVHRSKTCRQTIKHSDNVSRKVKITEGNGYIFTKKPPSFLFFTYANIGHIIPSTSPLDTWISNGNTYINNDKNHAQIRIEWQHKHGRYNSRVNECS